MQRLTWPRHRARARAWQSIRLADARRRRRLRRRATSSNGATR